VNKYQEGINEAGSISSFIAAGTSYSNHNINMIPFFIYYSMFGFQRVGDFVWAAADMRTKGFLLGGTAGRTTLAGEGLQHQDGHSHLMASAVPNLMLKAFASKCSSSCCTSKKKSFCAHICCSPHKVTNSLESKHRIIDKERYHINVVITI
jgi:hypothetical protein